MMLRNPLDMIRSKIPCFSPIELASCHHGHNMLNEYHHNPNEQKTVTSTNLFIFNTSTNNNKNKKTVVLERCCKFSKKIAKT